MGWVRQQPPPKVDPSHLCNVPMQEGLNPFRNEPAGQVGDLWRCDKCNVLWRIVYRYNTSARTCWAVARWWQRIWYKNEGYN